MDISQNEVQTSSSEHLNEVSAIPTDCHLGSQVLTLVSSNGNQFVVMSSDSDSLSLADAGLIQQGGESVLNLDESTRYLFQNHAMTNAVMLQDGTYQILDQPLVQVEREDGTIETQTLHIEVLRALQENLAQQMPVIDSNYTLEGMDSLDEASSSSIIKVEPPMNPNLEESVTEDSVDQTDLLPKEHQFNEQDEESMKEARETTQSDSSVETKRKKRQPKEPKKVIIKKDPETKEPDLNSPIPLSDQTIITVKGKKCVLAFNQETQQVCAYPLKPAPGTKRRGRPRLTEEEKAERKKNISVKTETIADQPASQTEKSNAAETLLELSNIGKDGVRRSARKRKKAKLFDEYEELEDSDEDKEPTFVDSQEKDPDIKIELAEAKKKKLVVPKEEIPLLSSSAIILDNSVQPPKKRGRGRPRRYPNPGQQQSHTSIPAVMIPSANGQTLVMAPLQGLQNLQNFRRQLPNLVPKPITDSNGQVTTEVSDVGTLPLSSDTDTMPLDTSGALDSNSIIPKALQGDSVPLVGENETSDQGETLDQQTTGLLTFMTPTNTVGDNQKDDSTSDSSLPSSQTTVIRIPNNLLASLGFKKDPVKIGLKATERELEKLKCPKCDFQGYYMQQYRNHIATHGDDIQKCKCCSYLSLDSDDLLEHFKEQHPRCICLECDYMAEHAYIIKRHMMRHDTKSCTCSTCGKVYKDMYILKMHIKMVHMPAEVLFECDVCWKKFTRKAHLKRHLRIHDPEKPYKCSVCDYRGCERSDISKHMLIHQDPKHACERCGKTFRHIKNKELHVKRHFGQRDYKCGVCDFFGYTFTDIRKHIERKHQDIKTLICDKCNKQFKSEAALKEHQPSCNSVMMIEQVLAIPTSAGGTSQATIQIPSNISQDGTVMIDGQAINLNGHTITVKKNRVLMVAGEQRLVMAERTTEEDEDEIDDVESGINQAMQIIGETIMTESGEEMHIISQESLNDPTLQNSLRQAHLIDQNGQLFRAEDLHSIVSQNGHIFYKTEQDGIDQSVDMIEEPKQSIDRQSQHSELDDEMGHQFMGQAGQPGQELEPPSEETLEENLKEFHEVMKQESSENYSQDGTEALDHDSADTHS
nr:Myoneurin [Biomphalaria glabrata]